MDEVQRTPPELRTVAVSVGESLQSAGPSEALRQVVQFINDLARLDADAIRAAVRMEPESTGDGRWDALLAGIAEYLSRPVDVATPAWASAPSRFLRRFWFVIEDVIGRPAPGLAADAFARTPPELSSRGVFLDRSSLTSR